jgi:hypothetical protein
MSVSTKTPVHFRVFPAQDSRGDVIALFPDTLEHDGYVNSYQHVGQHGAAAYNGLCHYLRVAKPGEYNDLLQELYSIGYENLHIEKRYKRRVTGRTT